MVLSSDIFTEMFDLLILGDDSPEKNIRMSSEKTKISNKCP
jgi:hypothetical protein